MARDVPTVTLEGDALRRLVAAAAALESEDLPPFAVIGGVAVAVRLGRAHRATADLDAVTDYRYAPTALEILRRRDDVSYDPAAPHSVFIAGAEVQFQDVAPVTDADVDDLDLKDALYVTGHAHALQAATPFRLVAGRGADRIEAVVPIATTGALVAMKLHAYLDRRIASGVDKRPGDLWDVYNLLLHVNAEAADDLLSGIDRLPAAVLDTIRTHLIDGAPRARGILRLSDDERYQAVTADEIRHAATDLARRLGGR